MRFIQVLATIFIILLGIISLDISLYDYPKKSKDIVEIARKLGHIAPSFSFSSSEHKEFVYAK